MDCSTIVEAKLPRRLSVRSKWPRVPKRPLSGTAVEATEGLALSRETTGWVIGATDPVNGQTTGTIVRLHQNLRLNLRATCLQSDHDTGLVLLGSAFFRKMHLGGAAVLANRQQVWHRSSRVCACLVRLIETRHWCLLHTAMTRTASRSSWLRTRSRQSPCHILCIFLVTVGRSCDNQA